MKKNMPNEMSNENNSVEIKSIQQKDFSTVTPYRFDLDTFTGATASTT